MTDAPADPDRIDRALDAWFAALDLIGGLKPHQRARYRKAMAAALVAADAETGRPIPGANAPACDCAD